MGGEGAVRGVGGFGVEAEGCHGGGCVCGCSVTGAVLAALFSDVFRLA